MSAEATPLERYLAEQADLTAVERFSKCQTAGVLSPEQGVWVDLVPLSRPGPGQQYGFEVDLDACTGCKACVTACHNVNDLDVGESHRSVGLLTAVSRSPAEGPAAQQDDQPPAAACPGASKQTAAPAFQQTVTTACHHCADPACLSGCPTNAYEKDAFTGIVAHLEDKCFGCGYCTWMCPYEVPKLNKARGVVRKCDMCQDRLRDGEAPACVSACPSAAISIRVVDTARLTAELMEPVLVPGAPPSSITRPATRYVSEWGLPDNLTAADAASVQMAHGHLPLVAMLVLTQMAVGALAFDVALAAMLSADRPPATLRGAVAVGLVGVLASIWHLGRPSRAWRAMAGFRHSWLSREAVALGAFATLGVAAVATGSLVIEVATLVAGVAGVASSAMLYAVTRRPWWRLRWTGVRFAMSSLVGGGALLRATAGNLGWQVVLVSGIIAAAGVAKMAWETRLLYRPEMAGSAAVCRANLAGVRRMRAAAGIAGGIVIPVLVIASLMPMFALWPALLLVLGAELAERYVFFTAASWSGMPGTFN